MPERALAETMPQVMPEIESESVCDGADMGAGGRALRRKDNGSGRRVNAQKCDVGRAVDGKNLRAIPDCLHNREP